MAREGLAPPVAGHPARLSSVPITASASCCERAVRSGLLAPGKNSHFRERFAKNWAKYRRALKHLQHRVVFKAKNGVIESFSKSQPSRFQNAGSWKINGIAASFSKWPHTRFASF